MPDLFGAAARLQASAAGGEILMCAATYEAVASAYPVAEPRELQLRGTRSTVPEFPHSDRLKSGRKALFVSGRQAPICTVDLRSRPASDRPNALKAETLG